MESKAGYYIPNTKGGIIRQLANCFGYKKAGLLPLKFKQLIAIYCRETDRRISNINKAIRKNEIIL